MSDIDWEAVAEAVLAECLGPDDSDDESKLDDDRLWDYDEPTEIQHAAGGDQVPSELVAGGEFGRLLPPGWDPCPCARTPAQGGLVIREVGGEDSTQTSRSSRKRRRCVTFAGTTLSFSVPGTEESPYGYDPADGDRRRDRVMCGCTRMDEAALVPPAALGHDRALASAASSAASSGASSASQRARQRAGHGALPTVRHPSVYGRRGARRSARHLARSVLHPRTRGVVRTTRGGHLVFSSRAARHQEAWDVIHEDVAAYAHGGRGS
jgi:hypothetical protein